MTPPTRNEQLTTLAITLTPVMVAGLKALFTQDHPGEPEPTDAEVRAVYLTTFARELATDDAWLAAHPNWNT